VRAGSDPTAGITHNEGGQLEDIREEFFFRTYSSYSTKFLVVGSTQADFDVDQGGKV